LYIVNFVSISFNLQIRFILQSKKESRRATNASKIIIDKREAKDNARETRKIEVETRSTKSNARTNAKATIIVATTTITIVDKKQLSKLHKQFACTYISFALEIASILLSCLLLFDNLQEYANNTLYSQKLVKLSN